MILLLTGTPGTGKTTISRLLSDKLNARLVAVNQLVDQKHLYTGLDPDKHYKIVDIQALIQEMDEAAQNYRDSEDWLILEGHLSHYYQPADLVVVLRASPPILEERLKNRKWKPEKVKENLEAEALDICAWEAGDIHGALAQEVDTTHKMPQDVVKTIIEIIRGERTSPLGGVNFLDQMDL
ncbi:AAA family ATPase [Methanobacterium sp. CWC-01]|uniref:adenylate kinase family protein n=1 Tax=Methanobacterium aridiramus TaxID=2584467 RepID=UPI0025759099|nr:adenylate kinase family protein [Methanobacterium sp. CWC-01]WJI09941.1 AAA family ATPase [Methanobacterium sp. CWC-01]